VNNLSNSAAAPSVLEGYISETNLARQLNRSVGALQRLPASQSAPSRIKIGRVAFYNIAHVREWLSQREFSMSRPAFRLSFLVVLSALLRGRAGSCLWDRELAENDSGSDEVDFGLRSY
jgi:hypothetical protein